VGTAVWRYVAKNNAAFAEFTASSVKLLGTTKLDLQFQHTFFSPIKSDADNAKVVADLASTLKSVGAVNIKAQVIKVTSIAQNIIASYEIPSVPVSNVDPLCKTIASVCTGLIEMLSMPSM
jgi:hypothetical protein